MKFLENYNNNSCGLMIGIVNFGHFLVLHIKLFET